MGGGSESKDCLSGGPDARSFFLPSACPCPLLPIRREAGGSPPRRACGVPGLCQPVTLRTGDSGTGRKAVRPRLPWAGGLGFITPGGLPAACPAAYPPTGRLRGPLLGLVCRAGPAPPPETRLTACVCLPDDGRGQRIHRRRTAECPLVLGFYSTLWSLRDSHACPGSLGIFVCAPSVVSSD